MKIKRAVLNWLTGLLIPVALIFMGILFLLTPVFLNLEYRIPGFPADSYGFSLSDRLKWANLAQQYLVNDAGVEFLANLKFPDGTALYNERELNHMQDVKNVVKPVLWIGYGSWIILLTLAVLTLRSKNEWKTDFLKGLRYGGWLTILLLILIGVFAITSFWNFFTIFHGLFFKGDSWLFFYSDTLIRLFPMRFWQDVFLMIGMITLGGSLALIVGLRPKSGRIE
jgi:integral membrane protein (TIGR01906 family)